MGGVAGEVPGPGRRWRPSHALEGNPGGRKNSPSRVSAHSGPEPSAADSETLSTRRLQSPGHCYWGLQESSLPRAPAWGWEEGVRRAWAQEKLLSVPANLAIPGSWMWLGSGRLWRALLASWVHLSG